jgi:hypothetical protein
MSNNASENPSVIQAKWDLKFRCDYCNNEKIFTISTILTHFRACPEAIYGSGKATDIKTAKQQAEKFIISTKDSKSTYKVSEKSKERERKNRYEADFKKKEIFPDRDARKEELTSFESVTLAWHPFYYIPTYFNNDNIPSESIIHYRHCVESIAVHGSSILNIRGVRQYLRHLQPDSIYHQFKKKVSNEILNGLKIVAEFYFQRLKSFSDCLFGNDDREVKYGTYIYDNWLNNEQIKLPRANLIKKILSSGAKVYFIFIFYFLFFLTH